MWATELTSLRIARSKHQKASASCSRSITIGEHISFIPGREKKYTNGCIFFTNSYVPVANGSFYLEHSQCPCPPKHRQKEHPIALPH